MKPSAAQYPFTRATVEAVSQLKKEPAWATELRLAAWDAYERAPLPDASLGFGLGRVQAYVTGPQTPVPSSQWPAELEHALNERGDEEGLIVQRDTAIQSRSISKEFSKKGVLFTDLDTAIQTVPELVEPYLGKLIAQQTPLAALSTALWSGGSFLYVPSHIGVHLPFHACVWMSQAGLAVFHRSLFVVEEGAAVTFIDEGVSAEWADPGLSVSTTEAFVGIRGCLNFFQLQNWGRSVACHRLEESEVGFQGRFLSGLMAQRAATTLEKVAELHPEVRV